MTVMLAAPLLVIFRDTMQNGTIQVQARGTSLIVELAASHGVFTNWTPVSESSAAWLSNNIAHHQCTATAPLVFHNQSRIIIAATESTPLPIRPMADTLAFAPGLFMPRVGNSTMLTSQLNLTSGNCTISWPMDRKTIAIAGPVFQVLVSEGANQERDLILALSPEDLSVARRVQQLIPLLRTEAKNLGMLCTTSITLIVASAAESSLIRELPIALHPASNLIAGVFAEHGMELPRHVAAALLAWKDTNADSITSLTDLFGQHLSQATRLTHSLVGTRPAYQDKESLLRELTDEVLSLLPYLSSQDHWARSLEDVEYFAAYRAGLIWSRIDEIAQLLHNTDLVGSANLAMKELHDALSTAIPTMSVSYLEEQLCAQRLEQSSRIEECIPTGHATGHGIQCVGSIRGFLEECGCKGGKAGGLKRILDALSSASPEYIQVINGNMIGRIGTPQYRQTASQGIITAIEETPVAARAIGPNELLALCQGEITITPEKWTIANIRGLPGAIPEYVDAVLSGVQVRIVALCDLTVKQFSRQEREYVRSRLVVESPESAILRCATIPPIPEMLFVTGYIHPSDSLLSCPVPIPECVYIMDRRVPRLQSGSITGFQASGMYNGHPVLFDESSGYGITVIDYDGRSVTSVSSSVLRQEVDTNSRAAILVRRLLESGAPNDGIELNWKDPLLSAGDSYVGSQACYACHQQQFEQWASTKHARAMATLQHLQRQYVPNCVACHTVGYGQDSGFRLDAPSTPLENVGCEVCHGPAANHVLKPRRDNIRRLPGFDLCKTCHTEKHSLLTEANATNYFREITH